MEKTNTGIRLNVCVNLGICVKMVNVNLTLSILHLVHTIVTLMVSNAYAIKNSLKYHQDYVESVPPICSGMVANVSIINNAGKDMFGMRIEFVVYQELINARKMHIGMVTNANASNHIIS